MSFGTIRTNQTFLFLACCLTFAANGLIGVMPGSGLPVLASNTHVPLNTAGLVFMISSLGSVIAVLLGSFFVKHIGSKSTIIIGLGGAIISSLVIPDTQNFATWLVAQMLQGLSIGFLNIGVSITLSLNFGDKLGEKLNLVHGSVGVGSLLASVVVSYALSLTGKLFGAFFVTALLCALCLLMLSVLQFSSKPAAVAQLSQPAPSSSGEAQHNGIGSILKQALLWLMALQVILYVGTESGFSNWVVTSMSKGAHITLQMAAPSATLFWIGSTVGRLLVSRMMKHEKMRNLRLLYIAILGGSASGMLTTAFLSVPVLCFIGCFFVGIFLGPIFPSLQSIATRRFSQVPTLVSSVVMTSSGVAGMLIPASIGALMPSLGMQIGLFIPALLCLLITLPFYLANKRERKLNEDRGQADNAARSTTPIYDLPTIELPLLEVAA